MTVKLKVTPWHGLYEPDVVFSAAWLLIEIQDIDDTSSRIIDNCNYFLWIFLSGATSLSSLSGWVIDGFSVCKPWVSNIWLQIATCWSIGKDWNRFEDRSDRIGCDVISGAKEWWRELSRFCKGAFTFVWTSLCRIAWLWDCCCSELDWGYSWVLFEWMLGTFVEIEVFCDWKLELALDESLCEMDGKYGSCKWYEGFDWIVSIASGTELCPFESKIDRNDTKRLFIWLWELPCLELGWFRLLSPCDFPDTVWSVLDYLYHTDSEIYDLENCSIVLRKNETKKRTSRVDNWAFKHSISCFNATFSWWILSNTSLA